MTLASRRWAAELLAIWFNRLSPADWYGGSDAIDTLLQKRFEREWHSLRHRPAGEFLTDPDTALAAILLFDQVPRNIHRDSADAFASDHLARAITHGVLARGWLDHYSHARRQFVLMPLMHSEAIADQRLSLGLFARPGTGSLPFARAHWRMIARFGRFPHRNHALGRASTATEKRAVAAGFSW